MPYPSIENYKDAIRQAEHTLDVLKDYRPVTRPNGELWFSSGNFAVVFNLKHKTTGELRAIKCFTRPQVTRAECYRLITAGLKDIKSSYLLSYQYLEKEIWVNQGSDGALYPVLSMEWATGTTLGDYVKQQCATKNTANLQALVRNFEAMATWLLAQPFAHGDLKPDNIMVRTDGSLACVDYDGIFVPAMSGQGCREMGSPVYRHPLRSGTTFDRHIDDFSLLVLLLELRLLAAETTLFNAAIAGDSLLANGKDWENVDNSAFCKHLSDKGMTKERDLLRLVVKHSSGHGVVNWDNVLKSNAIAVLAEFPHLQTFMKNNEAQFKEYCKNAASTYEKEGKDAALLELKREYGQIFPNDLRYGNDLGNTTTPTGVTSISKRQVFIP
jgi:serine/threonine protein kinase